MSPSFLAGQLLVSTIILTFREVNSSIAKFKSNSLSLCTWRSMTTLSLLSIVVGLRYVVTRFICGINNRSDDDQLH